MDAACAGRLGVARQRLLLSGRLWLALTCGLRLCHGQVGGGWWGVRAKGPVGSNQRVQAAAGTLPSCDPNNFAHGCCRVGAASIEQEGLKTPTRRIGYRLCSFQPLNTGRNFHTHVSGSPPQWLPAAGGEEDGLRVTKLFKRAGTRTIELERAVAGDIVSIAGVRMRVGACLQVWVVCVRAVCTCVCACMRVVVLGGGRAPEALLAGSACSCAWHGTVLCSPARPCRAHLRLPKLRQSAGWPPQEHNVPPPFVHTQQHIHPPTHPPTHYTHTCTPRPSLPRPGAAAAGIADTVAAPSIAAALPPGAIDPPTLSMVFSPNTSPLAGREGSQLTGTKIGERLAAEAETNVSLRWGRGCVRACACGWVVWGGMGWDGVGDRTRGQ